MILVAWAMLTTSLVVVACTKDMTIGGPFVDHNVHDRIEKVHDNLTNANDKVSEASSHIKDDADAIKDEANQARNKLTPEAKPSVQPHLENIVHSADRIRDKTKLLEEAMILLTLADEELLEAADRIKKMEAEAKDAYAARIAAEKDRDEALQREKEATGKMIRWLIVICIIGVGLALPVGIFGSPYVGLLLGAASIGTLVIAITVSQYFDYIAIGGLVVIGLAAAMVAYKLFVRDKAVKEIVQTTEIAKQGMGEQERRRVFGYKASPGLAYQMQSGSTESLVNRVRHRMKGMWEETIAGSRGSESHGDTSNALAT